MSKTYEVGSAITARYQGRNITEAFTVISVDEESRPTALKSNGDFNLSEALKVALQVTDATSACADQQDCNIIRLNNGRREDSSYCDRAIDYGHDNP